MLDESFHNPCGMKENSAISDCEKSSYKTFRSWEEGIQAHVDHLALYAGAAGYPKASTPDPRHFPYLRGTVTTVEALGGKWAPNPSYGAEIVQMMNKLKIANNPLSSSHYSDSSSITSKLIMSNFIWVWKLQSLVNKYGSVEKLIFKLKSLGITNVCIKFHEGASPNGGGINYKDVFLKYVNNFKNAGFTVGTWGYNYFNDVQSEADLINQALNNSDYYIFDVEDTVAGKSDEAERICNLVREKQPKSIIGYSSFPIVSYHRNVPYQVFNKYCDFASPQCYWGEMRYSVTKCMDQMIQDYRTYKLDKPIYPSIEAFGIDSKSYNSYAEYRFDISGVWDADLMDNNFSSFMNYLKIKE
jgi:hypothetical protein